MEEVDSNRYFQQRVHDILLTLRQYVPLDDPKDI